LDTFPSCTVLDPKTPFLSFLWILAAPLGLLFSFYTWFPIM